MDELLAHSQRGDIGAQAYAKHVKKVHSQAVCNAQRALAYYGGDRDAFVETIESAAVYHDLGKIDEVNQEILRRESRDPLPISHSDAGVAELLRLRRSEAAVLAAAHHAGLFSQAAEMGKQGKPFRILNVTSHVDARLDHYLRAHSAAGCPELDSNASGQLHRCGFTRRVALSCLVDADHGDTARHYGKEIEQALPDPKWRERLEALDRYVAQLSQGDTELEQRRNHLRCLMYDACRSAEIDPAIRACDAPVGSGKTTTVMAHLLRVAQKKKLRHIFVVLPFTNIIKQSVEVYGDALVLPGERPEDIVAEHHHQADFADISLRQLATLWRAPIIVTTAVQFFETLASHYPARLRKLHELPGSAVFVDETHAAMPSHLWPQVWRWLETWTHDWGGHIVLGSGSLPRFWELKEFVDPPKGPGDIPDLVTEPVRRELEKAEKRRITPERRVAPMDCDGLIEWVTNARGPRLLILNTVQSAAVVADRMRKAGHDVLHLSTALAPIHRDRIVECVKERLKDKNDEDWTLVATSCIEAGMNFSFRSGFRESCSTASQIQIGGRVSREGEYTDASVWDFRVRDPLLIQHPGFTVSRRVLDNLFDKKHIGSLPPSELAKEAMRREITEGMEEKARKIIEAEVGLEYPEVSKLCRVIDADTRTVVIDPALIDSLRQREHIDYRMLLRHSVQMWTYKITQLAVKPLFPDRTGKDDSATLYEWTAAYDPDFLGYMAGVMPLLEGLQKGCFLF